MQDLGPQFKRWEGIEKSQGDLGDGLPPTSQLAGYREQKALGLRLDVTHKAVREDPKLSTREKRAEIERIHAEAEPEVKKLRDAQLTKVAGEIASAIPPIEHPPIDPVTRGVVFSRTQTWSLQRFRTFYVNVADETWASTIRSHPGLVMEEGPHAGEIVPVIDDATEFRRAERLATPAQRRRYKGLVRLSTQLESVAGMMLRALQDHSLQTVEERFKRAG